MKLLVELELDESWDEYIPNDEDKIKAIVNPNLDGVNIKIIKQQHNKYNFVNSKTSTLRL